MKRILILPLVLIFQLGIGQAVKMENKEGTCVFQKVIDQPGKTKSDLYAIVKKWVISVYNNPNEVITADVQDDIMKGNGASIKTIRIGMGVKQTMRYNFAIEVKDDKVRYTMSTMVLEMYTMDHYVLKPDGTFRTNSQAASIIESSTEVANSIIKSLEKSLSGEVKKDDW